MLDLDQKRLRSIAQTGHTDTHKMIDMFNLWLTTTPTASRRQILEVLRTTIVEENTLADKYERNLEELYQSTCASPCTKAVSILQMNIQSLNEALASSVEVSQLLYCKRCISEATLDEMERIDQSRSLDDKKTTLLTAMKETVSSDYRKLKDIATVLSDVEKTRDIGREIMTKYEEKISQDDDSVAVQPQEVVGGNEDRASDILRNEYGTLSQSITKPVRMARLLHKEVISDEDLSCVMSTRGSVSDSRAVLLKAVRDAVHSNYKHLELFVTVLRKFSETAHIGDTIFEEYKHNFLADDDDVEEIETYLAERENSGLSQYVSSDSETEDFAICGHKIPFPRTMRKEFKEMRTKFGSTFYKVRLLFSEKNSKSSGKHKKKALDVNKMKMLLSDTFPDLQSELSHKETVDDVLDVVKRKCSIVDAHPLEVLAVQFEVKEAENIIIEHKEAAKEFCKSVSVSLSNDETLQAIPTRYLQSETITFVLNWNPDNTTLQDINDVLLELELLHKYYIIVEVNPGKSVVVTCYCPAEYTGSLIMAVLDKIEILQEEGLKKFILGNSTVWDAQVDLVNENKNLLVQINDLKAAFEDRDTRITVEEISETIKDESSETHSDTSSNDSIHDHVNLQNVEWRQDNVQLIKPLVDQHMEDTKTDIFLYEYPQAQEKTRFQKSELVTSDRGPAIHVEAMSLPIIAIYQDERKEFRLTHKSLTNKFLKAQIKVKISPMLLTTGGLPYSSKSTALRRLMKNVDKSITGLNEGDGIGFCEIFSARDQFTNDILQAPSNRNKGYSSVLYAGVESMIRSMDQNLVVLPATDCSIFNDDGLNKHLMEVMKNLYEDNSQKKVSQIQNGPIEQAEWDQTHTCGLALINVWDLGLSKIPTYLLSCLAGHLYNSHVWLFLDLLRDVDRLYEVPDIPPNNPDISRNDRDLIMKWRSRIRYLLSFTRLASKKNDKRRKEFCSIVATLKKPTNPSETKSKIKKLTEVLHTESKHLKINELIDIKNVHEFRTFDKEEVCIDSLKTLLINLITDELKQAQDVPLSYIFLRGMLSKKNKLYIKRSELQQISNELNMSPAMFQEFCCLFMSFGSIIDVSLIDAKSEWVILQPVEFLNKLDKLFYYKGDDKFVTKYGLVTALTAKKIFGAYSPVFMSFLESFHMAIKFSSKQFDLTLEGNSPIYYIPNVCTNLPHLQCTPISLHLVQEMNITMSHFRVLFIIKFLEYQPHIQIHHASKESTHINVTAFTSHSQLLFELVYLGDITEFRFPSVQHSHEDMNEVCGYVVKACHDIMSEQGDIKYNFAVMCSSDEELHPCKVQTYRHLLSFNSRSCEKCSGSLSDEDHDKIEMFNAAFAKITIPAKQMLNGEPFTVEDAANIADKLSYLSPEGARAVYKEFTGTDPVEETDWKLFMRMILNWDQAKKNSKREFFIKLSSISKHIESDLIKIYDLSSVHLKGSYSSRKR